MAPTHSTNFRSRLAVTLIPVVVTGALVAVVAGCGGGSDEPATLTKQQVIAQGSAICKHAEAGLKNLPEPSFSGSFADASPAQQQQARVFIRGYANLLDSSRRGLEALNAPAHGRQLLEGYLHDTGAVVDELRAASAAPAAQVEGKAQAAFHRFAVASKQTAEYGFPKGVCGSGSS
jgi:hypothetical protein